MIECVHCETANPDLDITKEYTDTGIEYFLYCDYCETRVLLSTKLLKEKYSLFE